MTSYECIVKGKLKIMSTIGSRLEEERKRLGYSQSEFGEMGGVKRQAQGNYESDDRRPDAEYLAGIADAGADIMYILKGIKLASNIQPTASIGVRDESSVIAKAGKLLNQIRALLEDLSAESSIDVDEDGYHIKLNQSLVTDILDSAVNLHNMATTDQVEPFDQESLEIAIECVELYIDKLDLKVSPAKKVKVIRMLYPLIRDDDENEVPDNVIDLLKLAAEVEEKGDNNEQQKETVATSNKGTG